MNTLNQATESNTERKVALVMAGGTGGHIFPALAVAKALLAAGWRVHWLGAPGSMEARIIAQQASIVFEAIEFSGVRGKGFATLIRLPLTLGRALWQSRRVLQRVQPAVVLGFGGYISFPAGALAALSGRTLMLHEQNSVAGSANKALAKLAKRVFTAFPQVLPKAEYIGNPLRDAFLVQAAPKERFSQRSGPLQILVMGGSLGAKALNDIVPAALAHIDAAQRPLVVHQSGEKQLEALRSNYQNAGVEAECVAFIEDTADAMAKADVIIARAGASTVCEIAAVGAAAHFVPFPHATDDHQTSNAKLLVEAGAAWMSPQALLRAEGLAAWLQALSREECAERAVKARALAQTQAVAYMVQACENHVEWQFQNSKQNHKQKQSTVKAS